MTLGSVLVKRRVRECPLPPGSWGTKEEKEKWVVSQCPRLFLPGGSWRGWRVRWVEGNRQVRRAFALLPCGAV